MSDEPKSKKPPQPPIPPWAWVFAAACGIIPVLTLGGAIPAMIGFGGAGGCIGVARNDTMPLAGRIAICVAITIGCWVAVIAIVGGLALAMGN